MDDASVACEWWDNGRCTGTPYCPPRCPRFVDTRETPLLVLPYTDKDFDALMDMYERLDPTSRSRGIPPVDRPRIEAWLAPLLARGWHLLAIDGDRVCGHVGAVPAESDTPEGLIFVDDAYHGRGIGGELLRQLVAYGANRAHEAIHLDVSTNNRTALGVFRNLGFNVVHRNVSEVLLALPLDDPVASEAQLPPAERQS